MLTAAYMRVVRGYPSAQTLEVLHGGRTGSDRVDPLPHWCDSMWREGEGRPTSMVHCVNNATCGGSQRAVSEEQRSKYASHWLVNWQY